MDINGLYKLFLNYLQMVGLLQLSSIIQHDLVGGFKHVLFSISYMGCHPSHWLSLIFFKMVIAPPTSYPNYTYVIQPVKTTNQLSIHNVW